ncbi:MAG: nucleotide exchange factor GrpE [Kordiimonas sp.]|nr:nucleotide exchange factor GrpE [Kordiimonas sp.]
MNDTAETTPNNNQDAETTATDTTKMPSEEQNTPPQTPNDSAAPASQDNPQPEKEQDAADPLAVAHAEIADLKDKLLRSIADGENVRRRAERDKADAGNYAITGFARDLLSVGDNLRRALESLPAEEERSESIKTFIEGVEMTERELHNVLEKNGIRKIHPEGEKFDHNLHQAMFEVPGTGQPDGTIVQVMQAGYVIKDRLLRPALVGVAKGGDTPKTEHVDTTA